MAENFPEGDFDPARVYDAHFDEGIIARTVELGVDRGEPQGFADVAILNLVARLEAARTGQSPETVTGLVEQLMQAGVALSTGEIDYNQPDVAQAVEDYWGPLTGMVNHQQAQQYGTEGEM